MKIKSRDKQLIEQLVILYVGSYNRSTNLPCVVSSIFIIEGLHVVENVPFLIIEQPKLRTVNRKHFLDDFPAKFIINLDNAGKVEEILVLQEVVELYLLLICSCVIDVVFI